MNNNKSCDDKKEGLSWFQAILIIIGVILLLNLTGLVKILPYIFPI